MDHLVVEHLPGEHAGLAEDFAAVPRIGVAVEIGAFVAEALAIGVDHDAEGDVVLLEAVADGEIAERRRVEVPGHGMAPRPVAVGHGADIERHGNALAGVEARSPHLGQIPTRTEIARAHLGIGFEAAAGEDHRLGLKIVVLALVIDAHPVHAAGVMEQRHRRRLVKHGDAGLLRLGVEGGDELRAAAPDL